MKSAKNADLNSSIHSVHLIWQPHVFPNMKKELSGRHFNSDDDVIIAEDHFLEVQECDC